MQFNIQINRMLERFYVVQQIKSELVGYWMLDLYDNRPSLLPLDHGCVHSVHMCNMFTL